MGIINRVFLGVLKSSLNASIIAVLIMIIKGLFHKKISPRIHHALWFLVLIRLLIPFLPESNLSVLNILQQNTSNIMYYDHGNDVVSKIDTVKDDLNNIDILNKDTNNSFDKEINSKQLHKTNNNELILSEENTIISNKINILSLIWLSGFLFIAIFILASAIRTKNKVIRLAKVTDVEILSIMDSCKKVIGIDKEIPLYTGDYFNSPCILGIINPCIYYPRNKLDNINKNNLYHILLHELAHFKRKDLLYNLICVLTLSLHWFNPLIWFVVKTMRVDRELACDAYVLNTIGESEATSYGMTIINFLENSSLNKNKHSLLYFNETSCKLERRIKMIKGFKKGSYKISMLTIVIGILISSVTLTDAITPTYNNSVKPINSIEKNKDKVTIFDPNRIENKDILKPNRRAYGDIKKISKVLNFKPKLPDYIPNGFIFKNVILINLNTNKPEMRVWLNYQTQTGPHSSMTFVATPITEPLEKFDTPFLHGYKVTFTKEEISIDNMKIIKAKAKDSFMTDLYYVWQNDGLQYTILRDGASASSQDDEIFKMIKSIKYPEDIKNVSYKNDLKGPRQSLEVYDTYDLVEAVNAIGFIPKLSYKLKESYEIGEISVLNRTRILYNEKDLTKKVFLTVYGDETSNNKFTFEQIKDKDLYKQIKNNNHIKNYYEKTINITSFKLENKDVYKSEKYLEYHDAPDEPYIITYLWEEDEYFCVVSLSEKIENHGDILKELINFKPLDIDSL